jgi:uncharacterized membrane protein YfcA
VGQFVAHHTHAEPDRAAHAGPAQTTVFVGDFVEVLLVVALGVVERASGRDLRGDRTVTGIPKRLLVGVAGFLGGPALLAVGGIYSIGGGSIIAPFLVTVLGLSVYTVAGVTLMGTFVTSVVGVVFFEGLAAAGFGANAAVAPDWLLGLTLGIGGVAGTYAGVRLQRYVPEQLIRGVLGALVTLLALRYVLCFALSEALVRAPLRRRTGHPIRIAPPRFAELVPLQLDGLVPTAVAEDV